MPFNSGINYLFFCVARFKYSLTIHPSMGANMDSNNVLLEVRVLEEKLRIAQDRAREYQERNAPLCTTPPISTAAMKESVYVQGVQIALHTFSNYLLQKARTTKTPEEFYDTVKEIVGTYNFILPEDPEARASVEKSMNRIRSGIL